MYQDNYFSASLIAPKSGNCFGSSEDHACKMTPSFETTNAALFETPANPMKSS